MGFLHPVNGKLVFDTATIGKPFADRIVKMEGISPRQETESVRISKVEDGCGRDHEDSYAENALLLPEGPCLCHHLLPLAGLKYPFSQLRDASTRPTARLSSPWRIEGGSASLQAKGFRPECEGRNPYRKSFETTIPSNGSEV